MGKFVKGSGLQAVVPKAAPLMWTDSALQRALEDVAQSLASRCSAEASSTPHLPGAQI